MRLNDRQGRWDQDKLLTVMRGGHRFTDWTQRVSSSAAFFAKSVPKALPAFKVIGFHNNGGTGSATAETHWTFAQLGFGAEGVKVAQHTVHMPMTRSNRKTGQTHALGPATSIHAGTGPGNCYAALMRNVSGTGKVRLVKMSAGTLSTLSEVSVDVDIGDVLSIGYEYDTDVLQANLTLLVNGVSKTTHGDSPGFQMVSLTARPGMLGIAGDSLASSSDFGHYAEEWWATAAYADTDGDIRKTFPALVGSTKIHIMKKRRYKADAKPTAKWILSKNLEGISFSYSRSGGCSGAKFTIISQDWTNGTVADPAEHSWQLPTYQDWTDEDWQSGDVRILVKYTGQEIGVGGSTGSYTSEEVWRGRIRSVRYDRRTRRAKVVCEGYSAALDEYRVRATAKGIKIREALEVAVAPALRTDESRTGPIDTVNIIGTQSLLDQSVDIDWRDVTVRSAVNELLALMPENVIWGVRPVATVDGQGSTEFYVQQATDPYTVDLAGGLAHPTFDGDKALTFDKRALVQKVLARMTVYGREIDDGSGEEPTANIDRVVGTASCRRAQSMYGTREDQRTESSAQDEGMAAKLAAAILVRKCGPKFSMSFRVVERIDGTHSFFHLLTPFAPWLAIRERADPDNLFSTRSIGKSGSADHKTHDRSIRRYGDIPGVALFLDGPNGARASLASTTSERALDKGWIVHHAIRFSDAHPGGASSFATIFGRQDATSAGWGALVWENAATGKLYWKLRSGANTRTIDTGIAVDPSTPANQVVHFTVYRDTLGDFHFYNGTSLARTEASFRSDTPKSISDGWLWGAGLNDTQSWKGSLDQFWVVDTTDLAAKYPGGVTGTGGFLARTNGKNLRRDEGMGLLRHVKFNEAHYIGTTFFLTGNTGNAAWTRNGTAEEAEKALYVLTDASPSMGSNVDATAISTEVARGWRLGELSNTVEAARRWGGPILMAVTRASYEVSPMDGTVDTTFELGDFSDLWAPRIASIEREIGRADDLLKQSGDL